MFTKFVPILAKLKALKTHGRLMWHAFKHADTPKWIKGFMLAVVVYLFSPIDIVPDVILLLGLTDDLVVVSAAMWFLGKTIPDHVKNSLETNANADVNTHAPAPRRQTTIKQPPVKRSVLKPVGYAIVGIVLIAAAASHPWVQAQWNTFTTQTPKQEHSTPHNTTPHNTTPQNPNAVQ